MFTLATYLHWQLEAQQHALSISRRSEHERVRADVPKIARELDALTEVSNGVPTPYRAYCEAIVAINCAARDAQAGGNFWELLPGERLAARKKMMQQMKWKSR